ncbi:MAG: LysR family transcriptional regulator substrate-binding protein [Anaerostipes sp.]
MREPGISYTEGSAMDREINEFFKEQEITPDIHYRTSSEEIQNFVACGLGWAFIAQNGTPMMKGLKILEMPEMTLKRATCLAMRKDRQLSKNAQKFLILY